MQSNVLVTLFVNRAATGQADCKLNKSAPIELASSMLTHVAGGLAPKGTWAAQTALLAPKGTW